MESESYDKPRDRIVMALGLVALLLFTANLMTFVRHHIPWRTAHHVVATAPPVHESIHVHVVEPRHQFEFRFDDRSLRSSMEAVRIRTQQLEDELRRESFSISVAPIALDMRLR